MKTIEQVLQLNDAHHEMVMVPQWDTEVRVQSITGTQRAKLESMWQTGKVDPAKFRVALLSAALKDPTGQVPWGTEEQILALMDKNAQAVELLANAALKVSGFSESDVETLEKN